MADQVLHSVKVEWEKEIYSEQATYEIRSIATTNNGEQVLTITVPPGWRFYWRSTAGQWRLAPQDPFTGPAGLYDPQPGFWCPIARTAALVAVTYETAQHVYWAIYKPDFDISQGGTMAYVNDRGVEIYIDWYVNDVPSWYFDNEGFIDHVLAVYNPALPASRFTLVSEVAGSKS